MDTTTHETARQYRRLRREYLAYHRARCARAGEGQTLRLCAITLNGNRLINVIPMTAAGGRSQIWSWSHSAPRGGWSFVWRAWDTVSQAYVTI